MTKWLLEASKDEINIDYETVIKLDGDPSYMDCVEMQELAEKHGCKYYTISELGSN